MNYENIIRTPWQTFTRTHAVSVVLRPDIVAKDGINRNFLSLTVQARFRTFLVNVDRAAGRLSRTYYRQTAFLVHDYDGVVFIKHFDTMLLETYPRSMTDLIVK